MRKKRYKRLQYWDLETSQDDVSSSVIFFLKSPNVKKNSLRMRMFMIAFRSADKENDVSFIQLFMSTVL